jgi:hypothetical protein
MKKLLSLLAFGLALLATPALAQQTERYRPGERISDANPPPTKLLCWDGNSYEPCTSGDASAANQATQITAEQLTNTILGAVTASPTANTIGDRLKVINTTLGTPLQAGGTVVVTGVATAANQSTEITALSTINTTLGTPLQAGGAVVAAGNVASGATDSGNPLKLGGVYNSTLPTFTNGQRGDLQIGTRGSLAVTLFDQNGTTPPTVATVAADAQSTSFVGLQTRGFGYVYNGTNWDRQVGNTSGVVTQPYAVTGSRWQYAAASGGISNSTTAVTVVAAAGGSLRNYVTSIQCDSDALGAATELAYRDGAGGTVLWRAGIGTAGWPSGRDIVFPVPLKGTANTLGEIVTLTASVTGAVRCNLQGFSAL